jgi:shikimate 5-dehydrogenase
MHLVAVVCSDPGLSHLLRSFRDDDARFHLHVVAPGRGSDWVDALRTLDFAGALVLDAAAQADAMRLADRSSLDAADVAAADTLTVTQAGLVAEYHLGRALSQALRGRLWDPRGAHAVILGGGTEARAVARELASVGIGHLTVLADTRPHAERAVPRLAASTEVIATVPHDPIATRLLERADLVIRIDARVTFPSALLGPHLTIVDLAAEGVSSLRQRAMGLGALTLNRRDIEAHRLHLALGHVLGGGVRVEPLMQLMHQD